MEGMHVDRRRQELAVDDEDGLLRLQAEFLAGHSSAQPAARVTRISRKPQQQTGSTSATHASEPVSGVAPPSAASTPTTTSAASTPTLAAAGAAAEAAAHATDAPQQQCQPAERGGAAVQQDQYQQPHQQNKLFGSAPGTHTSSLARSTLPAAPQQHQQQQQQQHQEQGQVLGRNQQQEEKQHHYHHHQQQQQEQQEAQEQMCPVIPGILSDVKERKTDATGPPAAPSAAGGGAGAAAFPKAMHRKESKFALARRKQHPQPSQGTATAKLTTSSSGSSRAPPAASTAATAAAASAAVAAAAARSKASVPLEAAGIHEQNLQLVAGMSVEEVQEAQAEITQRFSPAALEFLKQRANKAAAKQQQQQQGVDVGAEGGSSSSQGSVQHSSRSLTVSPASRPPAAATTGGFKKGFLGGSKKAAAASTAAPADSSTPTSSHTAASMSTGNKAAAAAAGESGAIATGEEGGTAHPASRCSSSNSSSSSSTNNHPGAAVGDVASTQELSSRPAGIKHGFMGSKPSRTQQQQQQQLQQAASAATAAAAARKPLTTADAAATTAAAATGGRGLSTPQSPPLPPVARLRFSLHGQVLELEPTDALPAKPEDVLLRDNISRAEGAVPEGYTLPELAVLVRSRHAPQRAAGFRVLAAVLRRAQPLVQHAGWNGQLQPQPVLLDVVLHQQPQQQQQQPGGVSPPVSQSPGVATATGVMWFDVWEYAVVVLRAVMLCRLGLDEDNAQVLAAAADALRVLLGRSSSELLLEEVAAASSSISWPHSWRGQLRRISREGPWDTVENLVKAAQQADGGGEAAVATSPEGDDSSSPEELAAVDPLAGFMASDPLPRMRFILQRYTHNTEAIVSLLGVLEAVASSSKTAAEALVRIKGLPEALLALLQLGPLGGSSGSSSGGSSGSDGCRVPALRLLRLVSSASPMALQLLRSAGLEAAVQYFICSSSGGSGGSSTAPVVDAGSSSGSSTLQAAGSSAGPVIQSLLLKLEALRIWRVAAAFGIHLCHMDGMFPYLAALLQPLAAGGPPGSSGSNGSNSSSGGLEAMLTWQLSCEAFQLLEVLLRHALAVSAGDKTLGREMITPGCAAAVAQEAAAVWVEPEALREVGQALVSLSDCQLPYHLDPNQYRSSISTAAGAASSAMTKGSSTAVTNLNSSSSSSCSTVSVYSSAEGAAEQAAWQRVLSGLHPALLLPAAVGVLSAFAAVMQYLAAYWTSLQMVPKQLTADLLSQLEAAGLTTAAATAAAAAGGGDAGSRSDKRVAAAAAAASQQHLARVLLTASGQGFQQQQHQHLGGALVLHCLQLLQAASPNNGAAALNTATAAALSSSCSGISSGDQLLSIHAFATAAAAALLGICELQYQLQQHTQQQQQQDQLAPPQQQQQRRLEQVVTSCNPCSLAPDVLAVVSSSALQWVAHAPNNALAFDPWRLAHYTLHQYQLRVLLRLTPVVLHSMHREQLKQQQQESSWHILDGLLSVLPLSGPGQELQALQALQLLFELGASSSSTTSSSNGTIEATAAAAAAAMADAGSCASLDALVASAEGAIQQLLQQGGPVAAAAAGLRSDCLNNNSSSSRRNPEAAATTAAAAAAVVAPSDTMPYPPPAAAAASEEESGGHAVAGWARTLLQGYAITWLSVIAVDNNNHQQQQQHGTAADSALKALLPLPRAYVADTEGSRLPVPHEWLMSEILAVPHDYNNSSSCRSTPATGNSSSSSSIGSSLQLATEHPVSAALMLALGLERAPASRYMAAIPTGRKLEALLQLLYTFNAWELLEPAAAAASHRQQRQQQQLPAAWQDPSARWAAAALADQYVRQVLLEQSNVVVHSPGLEPPPSACATADSSAGQGYGQAAQQECAVHQLLLQSHLPAAPQQQQQQWQPPPSGLLLFPRWSSSTSARQLLDRLVQDLAETSFGDPLFGMHVALLLLPAAGVRLQRACWAALVDHRALHLLPPPWRCFGGSWPYLGIKIGPQGTKDAATTAGKDISDSSNRASNSCCDVRNGVSDQWGFEGRVFQGFDPQLVGDMARSLAQGDLKKALQMLGLAGLMAMHGIAALCLDQRAWQHREVGQGAASGPTATSAAAVAAGTSASSPHASSSKDSPAPAAAGASAMMADGAESGPASKQSGSSGALATESGIAVNVLRGVVRGSELGVLRELMRVGELRGQAVSDQRRALVQAAHGDATLMDKVRQLLQ